MIFLSQGQVVPKTCCVLSNSDPNSPNPKDFGACQQEASKSPIPTVSPDLQSKVSPSSPAIGLLSYC